MFWARCKSKATQACVFMLMLILALTVELDSEDAWAESRRSCKFLAFFACCKEIISKVCFDFTHSFCHIHLIRSWTSVNLTFFSTLSFSFYLELMHWWIFWGFGMRHNPDGRAHTQLSAKEKKKSKGWTTIISLVLVNRWEPERLSV